MHCIGVRVLDTLRGRCVERVRERGQMGQRTLGC